MVTYGWTTWGGAGYQVSLDEACKRNFSLKMQTGFVLVGEQLLYAAFDIRKVADPDGNVHATLWRSGVAVATSNELSNSSVTTSFVQTTFTFSSPPVVEADDYISLTAAYSTSDPDTDYIQVGRSTDNPTAANAKGAIGCGGSPNDDNDNLAWQPVMYLESGSAPAPTFRPWIMGNS